MTRISQFFSFKCVHYMASFFNKWLMNNSKMVQSYLKGYGIPFFIVVSLYVLFHNFVDDFLYSKATLYFDEGLTIFWLFVASNIIVYLFGALIWLEHKGSLQSYTLRQKLRGYLYVLKLFIIAGMLTLCWRILQYIPPFNDSHNLIVGWCFVGILVLLIGNVIFWQRANRFCNKRATTSNTGAGKKELKADSVDAGVKEVEDRNEPEDPFIIARNGLKSIVDRVFSNSIANLGEGSFIVGVNGEWGSGKSTLIELVKRQMDGDVHIIEFNPWTSHQLANLTVDFFKTIAASIGSFTMRRTLVKYGVALSKGIKREFGDALGYLEAAPSLDRQLKDISSYIKRKEIKLLIIIDDIDRMDGDEILAVFKLARRSGNLPNTVYLLAFNHDYVEKQICHKIKGANDGDSFNYIDKIINLPFDVPKLTADYFVGKLAADLLVGGSIFEKDRFFPKYSDTSSLPDIVKNHLSNFRAYKKIYNAVVVQYYYYKNHIFLDDFIVLKTLQIYDVDLYTLLIEAIAETRKESDPNLFPLDKTIGRQDNGIPIIRTEKNLLIEQIEAKSKLKEVEKRSLIDYIKKSNYGTFIRRRLIISALKIHQNKPVIADCFDTLEFSTSNFEVLKKHIATDDIKKQFVYDCILNGLFTISEGDQGKQQYLYVLVYFLFVQTHPHPLEGKVNSIIQGISDNRFTLNPFFEGIEFYSKEFANYDLYKIIVGHIKVDSREFYDKHLEEFDEFIEMMELIASKVLTDAVNVN